MGAVVFTKCKSVCLFFASLFVSVAGSYGSVDKFTITPKNKEVFVGGSVQFDWDYAFTDVSEVRFGLADREHFRKVAIYIKLRNGTLKFNHMSESVKWIRKRVEVVPNRRASFKINSVQMDDSKTFFCLCIRGALKPTILDYVRLTVVDLLIDDKESTQFVESWQGHIITVVCAVKLPAGERLNAKFSWMHIPSNRTVARRNHDDERSKSYLTITTYKDEDFEELQCRAETKNTVKYHVINITRLSLPTQPRNLKAERRFDTVNGVLLIRLSWEPPQSNGGATIEKYIVSYRPNELPWKQSTHLDTEDSLFYDLRLQSGTTYHARVRAKNKAGIGPLSNEVEVNLAPGPPRDVKVGTASKRSVTLSWKKPLRYQDDVQMYTVIYEGTKTYYPKFKHTDSVQTVALSREISDLYPDTKYNFVVVATTHYGDGDNSTMVTIRTVIDAPPPPENPGGPQQIEKAGSSVSLTIWPAAEDNGPISYYQILVHRVQDWTDTVTDWNDLGSNFYISAQIPASDVKTKMMFLLGDGENKGGYKNKELASGQKYKIYSRALTEVTSKKRSTDERFLAGQAQLLAQVQVEGTGKFEDQELTGKSPTAMVVSVVVVLLVLIIGGAIAGVIFWRRRQCQTDHSSEENELHPLTGVDGPDVTTRPGSEDSQPQTSKDAEKGEPIGATCGQYMARPSQTPSAS